jgi:hypothetical protein
MLIFISKKLMKNNLVGRFFGFFGNTSWFFVKIGYWNSRLLTTSDINDGFCDACVCVFILERVGMFVQSITFANSLLS